jgi:hypothetical protein
MKQPNDPEWDEFHDAEIVDWKRIRSAIEHENTLTNHRLTWLLTSQGFLLAAFALVFQASTKTDVKEDLREFYKFVLAAISFTGILISAYLRFGLRAAWVQHDYLRNWWLRRPETGHKRHPDVCGTNYGWFTDRLLTYHNFPFVFMITWLFLIPVVMWDYLKPHASQLGVGALALVVAIGLIVIGIFIGRRRSNQPLSKQS